MAQGHAVEIAPDGLIGLEKAQMLVFDAIILDVMLPGLDGLHLPVDCALSRIAYRSCS